MMPDPPFRSGLHDRGQAAEQAQPQQQGKLLAGQQLQRGAPAVPQPQIGPRVQLVEDGRRLVLPFLPRGRRGARQGVGRGAAQAETMLRQTAELPMKSGIVPADPAQSPVSEAALYAAESVRIQQDADAVFILPQQGFAARDDPGPDPLPLGAGEPVVEGQGLRVGDDLPACAAAAVGAASGRADEGAEAGGSQVLHGLAICLSISTQSSMSSTGIYS